MNNNTPWVKASKSANNNDCVELRSAGETIEVRDSKDQSGSVLTFTSSVLAAWIDGAKRSEFDHLV